MRKAATRRLWPTGIALLAQHSHHHALAQAVMVVEIFVPQRNPIDPLTDQGLQTVLGPLRIAVVSKTPGKTLENTQTPLHLAQHQPAAIRTEHPAVRSPAPFA